MIFLDNYTFGFSGYLFWLCVLSGLFLLLIDAKQKGTDKTTRKIAKVFGWVHLGLGMVVLTITLLQ